MKRMSLMLVALNAAASLWAEPVVLEAVTRQCRPLSAKVLVDYDLYGTEGGCAAIGVSVFSGSLPMPIPTSAISGEVMPVGDGHHQLVIDTSAFPTSGGVITDFRVMLTASAAAYDPQEVLYRVVDLQNGAISDVTRGMLMSGAMGAVATNYDWATSWPQNVPTALHCIWLEPASNALYKTSRLVLRKLPAGTFKMGVGDVRNDGSGRLVTLSKGFSIGVFEMTQAQCKLLSANLSTPYFSHPDYCDTRPMDMVSYVQIRGADKGLVWPENFDRSVDGGSYISALRVLTHNEGWDLPTEAQWEYACRATTKTTYNNGYNGSSSTAHETAAIWVSRNKANSNYGSITDGSTCDLATGTAGVGSYCPNPWGVFDTHGNVWEWTLDRYSETLSEETLDPVGVDANVQSSSKRVIKGGCYSNGHTNILSGGRDGFKQKDAATGGKYGFRVILAD